MKLAIQLRRQKKVNRSLPADMILIIILAGLGTFMAIPFVYMIGMALKPLDEMFLFPPTILVRNPTLNNFFDLFNIFANSWVPISRYMFNTFFIAFLGTGGHVILASMAAYPLAKLDIKGKKVLFTMVVLSLMFSPIVTSIPNYLTITWLGMLNTYWSVIIPAFASSLGLFLMKQFMEQIPDAIIESAKIDGASEYRIFWNIVMPTVKPAWLTLIIFSFNGLWGGGMSGTFIYSEQLKPMGAAFATILAGGIARTGAMSVAALIMMIVPIGVFIFSQSNVIETMSTSGMKD